MTIEVVFGTRNPGKVSELAQLLEPYGVTVSSLLDHPDLPDAVEDKDTFAGNAIKKAQHIADLLGCMGVADDSGLVVDALDGRPGVLSARYGGPGLTAAQKNELLLGELEGVAEGQRTARFVCVLATAQPAAEGGEGQHRLAEGICEGVILDGPRGKDGFGFDPVFGPVERPGQAMAELDPHDKNSISHRGRAARALLPELLVMLGIKT